MPARPRLYLHIGAGKSGSSAIQLALKQNYAVLRDNGVLVPASDLSITGRVDGHQVPFFEGLLPIDAAAIASVTHRLEELRGHLEHEHLHSLAISSENLINSRQFARLFVEAQEIFDLQVVVYIRRQDDYIQAAWNQWYFKVRESFESWLGEVRGSIANWHRAIEAWEEELPDSGFNVRIFDRQRLVGHDAIVDFMNVLDVPIGGLSLPIEAVNRGLNQVAMRVASRNRGLFSGPHDNRFTDFLSSVGGEKSHVGRSSGTGLSPDIRREVMDAYAASNELLRRRHFPELPEGGLFETGVSDGETSPDEQDLLIQELDLLWAALFAVYGRLPGRR